MKQAAGESFSSTAGAPDAELPPVGRVTVEAGRMTLDNLLFSLDLIRKGLLDGSVFAPLNKEALMKGGHAGA